MKWNAIIYTRGSKKKLNFDSIKDFLNNHIEINLIDTYIDCNECHFNNYIEFFKMMEKVEKEKIDTIIVRKLEDLGHNYFIVYQYLSIIFPILNIRFISIEENIDTFLKPESLDEVINNLKMWVRNVDMLDERTEKEIIELHRKMQKLN